jgi:DNA polymerase-3 subunit delta
VTATQLIGRAGKGGVPPVILLLGSEAYDRRRVRDALSGSLPPEAVTSHDLMEMSLAEVIDDARALSLFASERLLWVTNAEVALPRGKAVDDSEGESGSGDVAPLNRYVKDPTPGVTLVFEASRFDFEGEDKKKLDRVRTFYGAVREVVELRAYSSADARREAEALTRRAGFRMEAAALDLLVEALAANIARISVEIEKLSLYANGRAITEDDIAALVPDARAGSIFELVNALGRRDRSRALEILDTLMREGEYIPLALSFLATQFRMALAAREAGLKSASQIQAHFTRLGVPMWGSRADQVNQTMTKFNQSGLERGLKLIYQVDKSLRDARPDDRVVVEEFILQFVA